MPNNVKTEEDSQLLPFSQGFSNGCLEATREVKMILIQMSFKTSAMINRQKHNRKLIKIKTLLKSAREALLYK
jgi:hypothetical protein